MNEAKPGGKSQQIEVLALKSDTWISSHYPTVDRENQLQLVVLWPPQAMLWHTHAHT